MTATWPCAARPPLRWPTITPSPPTVPSPAISGDTKTVQPSVAAARSRAHTSRSSGAKPTPAPTTAAADAAAAAAARPVAPSPFKRREATPLAGFRLSAAARLSWGASEAHSAGLALAVLGVDAPSTVP